MGLSTRKKYEERVFQQEPDTDLYHVQLIFRPQPVQAQLDKILIRSIIPQRMT
jgi:hypothetical protein